MKTKTIFLFFLTIVSLPACRKYEDGPSFSLRTKKTRLVGRWLYQSYFTNGIEHKIYGRVTHVFREDGTTDFMSLSGGDATWHFRNYKKEILVRSDDGSETKTLVILRLTNDELWYTIVNFNNVVEERHFVADN